MDFLERAFLLAFGALVTSQLALVAGLTGVALGLPSSDSARGFFFDGVSVMAAETIALPAASVGWMASLAILRRANLSWALPIVAGTAVLASFLGVLALGPIEGVVIALVASLFAMALAPDESWPPSSPLSPNGPWSATSTAADIGSRVRERTPQVMP